MVIRRRGWGEKEAKTAGKPQLDREEVARVAYTLYLQRGGVNGRALEDWLKAEEIVKNRL